MPNGNPKFHEEELPALESFFSEIAGVLNRFASSHNLMLDKYYHQSHSWRFNFRHPKGGVASIDVMKESDDSIKIYLYWWVDDYDKFTRFARTDETPAYEVGSIDLAQVLEERLRTVLSWEPGTWTQVAMGYEQFWKPQGEKWLQKDVERYPMPKV